MLEGRPPLVLERHLDPDGAEGRLDVLTDGPVGVAVVVEVAQGRKVDKDPIPLVVVVVLPENKEASS